jgi:hypothetical protein
MELYDSIVRKITTPSVIQSVKMTYPHMNPRTLLSSQLLHEYSTELKVSPSLAELSRHIHESVDAFRHISVQDYDKFKEKLRTWKDADKSAMLESISDMKRSMSATDDGKIPDWSRCVRDSLEILSNAEKNLHVYK